MADNHNLPRLEQAFPGIAAAMAIYQQEGGPETLLNILNTMDGE